jgi:hypothetical protein
MKETNQNAYSPFRSMAQAALMAFVLAGITGLVHAANQKVCKAKEAEFSGECVLDWSVPRCTSSRTRVTYYDVGICKAEYEKNCPAAESDGTYTQAVAECVLNAGGNACITPSWGPESDPQPSANPECNP